MRQAVVMQSAALRRERSAWMRTTYLAAHLINHSLNRPNHGVTPKQLLDQVFGAGGLSDEELQEMKRLHEARRRHHEKKKRRARLGG